MFTTSSHPIRKALGAAAMSVTALLASANLGHAQELLADSSRGPRLALEKQPSLAPIQPAPYGRDHVFTPAQCERIILTVMDEFRRVGANNLSPEFRQSWVDMIMQGGQRTCTGQRIIQWRTRMDEATHTSIVSRLEASADHIYLERAGVSLAPTPVASLSLR